MTARVYVIPLSNPAASGVAMVAYKRLPHRVVRLPPGVHPLLVRAAGFRGWTVPALELRGRKIQGTMQIARALDELVPDPPLFPAEPEERERVERAERWGHFEFQPVPRRLIRLALSRDPALRRWMSGRVLGLPLQGLAGEVARPMINTLAAVSKAKEATVREDLRRLPELLDHVDSLLEAGVIGGPAPNAADFQILATVRVLLEFENLAALTAGRPGEAPARRLYPHWVGPVPATPVLAS